MNDIIHYCEGMEKKTIKPIFVNTFFSIFILLLDILIVIIGLEHLSYVFVRLTAVTIAVFRQGIPVIFRFVL